MSCEKDESKLRKSFYQSDEINYAIDVKKNLVNKYKESLHRKTLSTNIKTPIMSSEDSKISLKVRLKRHRKRLFFIILYAWLFINNDPNYSKRALGAMMLSRALRMPRVFNRSPSLADVLDKIGSNSNRNNGLSTVEAIALIQAINSNKQISAQSTDLIGYNGGLKAIGENSRAVTERQLPLPIQRQVGPVPLLIATLVAIINASTGSPPITTIFRAFFAALIAILAIIAPGQKVPMPPKSSPIVKKLVIKKTVLPFVIPIPIKGKGEKEKEKKVVVYVKKKPHHAEHHAHHEEEFENKVDKTGDEEEDDRSFDKKDVISPIRPPKGIENVLDEQERLQALSDMLMSKPHEPGLNEPQVEEK